MHDVTDCRNFTFPADEHEQLINLLLKQLKGKNARVRGQAVRLLNALGCVREDVLAAMLPLLLDSDVSNHVALSGACVCLLFC